MPELDLACLAFRDNTDPENRDSLTWTAVAAASPYFTELESARYCRCGVARLRSWDDRGYLTVRTDVDGRRFYVRDELDRVMQGLVEEVGEAPAGRREAPPPKAEPRSSRTGGQSTKAKRPNRPALPYTDAEKDSRRRGKGGGR